MDYRILPEPDGHGWIVMRDAAPERAALCNTLEDALFVARICQGLERTRRRTGFRGRMTGSRRSSTRAASSA